MNHPSAAPGPPAAGKISTRLASAAVLLGASLSLIWAGPWTFAALVLAVSLTVLWEWSTIGRGRGLDTASLIGAAAVVAGIALTLAHRPLIAALAVAAGAVAAGVAAPSSGRRLNAALGALYAGLPAIALLWLRADQRFGLAAILFVMVVVWTTDSAAFAAGRTIGGPKLCPRVSPNKTWAGLVGGVAAASIAGGALGLALGTQSLARVVATSLALAIVSQIGDLVESAYKRANGAKDASQLIPGHGGFMDRVDGLVFAAMAAAIYAAVIDPGAPGAVLLALK